MLSRKALSWRLIMSSQRFKGRLATLILILSCCRSGFAIAPAALEPAEPSAPSGAAAPSPLPAPSPPSGIYVAPQNPATGINDLDSSTPALRALPVSPSDLGSDASLHRKFYTFSASLREIYDGNVSTSNNDQQSSLDTDLTASVLVNFPITGGAFSARYSLGATYYSSAPNFTGNGSSGSSGGTNKESSLAITHEVNAQYAHSFSDRLQFSLAEDFRYFTEPSIMESLGSNYQSGAYIGDTLTAGLSAQLTPLWSSSSSYALSLIRYDNSTVGDAQDSIENTASQSVGYALFPKITTSGGALVDNITYQSGDRGYTTYTAFGGVAWQALPSLSFSARAGATYIQTVQSQGSIAPYGALTGTWQLGARSSLSFNYAHEVTPTDQVGSNGQLSDRFSSSFSYQITTRLSAHLDGIFTSSSSSGSLSTTNEGNSNNYDEKVYQLDTGFAYSYNSYLSLDTGITLSGVLSNNDNNNYTRDEVYIGVRGTY
jgi:hypothetical protein